MLAPENHVLVCPVLVESCKLKLVHDSGKAGEQKPTRTASVLAMQRDR